jgi:hypothetical protein
MQDMPGKDMQHGNERESATQKAKRAADKRKSELSHHFAGLLLIFAGAFLLAEDKLRKRWPWTCYVWPTCFLAAGFYLLLFSDTEIWPVGLRPYMVRVKGQRRGSPAQNIRPDPAYYRGCRGAKSTRSYSEYMGRMGVPADGHTGFNHAAVSPPSGRHA